jgi:PAS domain S-box-containing protein
MAIRPPTASGARTSMPLSVIHTVLVVEDERIVAKDLQYMLNSMGYDAFAIASSADDALSRAAEHRPDLVLMDIRIKGSRDGIETADLLRKRFGIPVVYLTAHSDDATLERAKLTVPYGYLMKPVKSAELRSAIEIAIHRHAMERQLRERERWFSTTLRSINDAVITVDLAGRVAFINPAAERLTGVASGDAIGTQVCRLVRVGDPAQPTSPLDEVLEHRRNVVIPEAPFEAANGTIRLISGSAAPVVDGGDLLGAVMVFRDITDQTRMQRQLENADRLASLGTLTSGVAHQINNPLAVVLANASYLRGELDDITDALGDVDEANDLAGRMRELSQVQSEITAAGWRIGKIVADLKAFSRPTEPVSDAADIGRAIGWAIRTTEHEFTHRARLTQEVAALPPVRADEARLGQVFVNLLMNAAQAIAPGTANDNEVAISGRAEGERIIVEVRDTGPGIAPDDLERIFEPFFTTRAIGQGTGLGLSVCHGIVTSIGGELQVESRLGSGTTFRVILRAAPRLAAGPSAPPAPGASRRRGRILVIDDDAMVHRTIKRLLRDHELVVADNAREALACIERGERFDLILSDLLMPIMTGIELHEQITARDPAQARRIVFMTGGALTTRQSEGFLQSVPNATLEKPFGVPEIQSLVERMLGDADEIAPANPRAASGES